MKCDNLTQIILHMYPNAVPNVDFRVLYENGGSTITVWNLTQPQPTEDEAIQLSAQVALANTKMTKKSDLSQQCNQAIVAGFTSSALGQAHTYPSDEEAQRNFNSEINKFVIDSTYTTSLFKTLDAGYLPHSKDQLFQVFSDGHASRVAQLAQLNQLKAQVDAVQTQADLDKITWVQT